MRVSKLALTLAIAGGLAAPARAQAPPAVVLDDPDAVVVEELVVTARDRGPAWWRVEDADTVVYVLGVPSTSPKGLAWDRSVLERRLKGANVMIQGLNSVRISIASTPRALVTWARIRSRKPYEERLEAGLKGRFVAARTRLGQPAKRYGYDHGLVVAMILGADYLENAKLTNADPVKTIGRLAKARKVKVESRSLEIGDLIGPMMKTPQAVQRACLEEVLAGVEAGPGAIRRASEAWAQGDVRGALGGERGMERCLASVPGAAAVDERLKAQRAASIARALKTPGHAVAIVELRPLLAQDGVLARLRAQGFTVKTPGEG